MNAAGTTITVNEIVQESPWPSKGGDPGCVIQWLDGSRALIDRAEYVDGVLLLSVEAESAQSKLNDLVAEIEKLAEDNPPKTIMLGRLIDLFDRYEPETT